MAMNRKRGYTLIELLVAVAISLLVSAVTVGIFLNQQVRFAALDLTRTAQESARDALLEMEPSMRRAGFGIDPRYVLDFNQYACASTPCRDSVTGSDHLVFVARNPFYTWSDVGTNGCATTGGCFGGHAWPIALGSATSVTVTANAGDVFVQGRVVQGVCTNGTLSTMGTLSTTVTSAAGGATVLPLSTTVAGNPYKDNNFAAACFASPGAGLFLVDRYHYEIVAFGTTPYLMLDNGMDNNNNGTTPDQGDLNDLYPVAKNVEDLQVAYLLNVGTSYGFAAPDSNQDWIVGNQSGNVEEPNPAATAPLFTTATNDPTRFNLNPANVVGLRLTFSVRSAQVDQSQAPGWPGTPLSLAENRSAQLTSLGQYQRYSTATSVVLRNMQVRSTAIF